MSYKYEIKVDVQPKEFNTVVGPHTHSRLHELELSVARIKQLIEVRRLRVKQLDGAASAASEYLRSKLQEIPDAEQNRLFICNGIESIIRIIDEQIAEHTAKIVQLLNP